MLIFVKEDIFINKEHRYGEWEKDQSVFKRIWDSFEKTQIKVVPGENIVMQQLTHESLQMEFTAQVPQYEER